MRHTSKAIRVLGPVLLLAGGILRAEPPAVPESKPTDSGALQVNQDADRIKNDPAFRHQAAGRIIDFLKAHGFADPAAVAAEDQAHQKDASVPDYWTPIGVQLEAAMAQSPAAGAAIFDVLGPNQTDADKKAYAPREQALADFDDPKSNMVELRTSNRLEGSAFAATWVSRFLEKGALASGDILRSADLDPAKVRQDILAKTQLPPAPIPSAESALGGVPPGGPGGNSWDAHGYGYEEMYAGKYRFKMGDRDIGVRYYADDDGNGGLKYRIGIFDITNPGNIHGVYVPIDATGTTKFTLTDRSGQARDYTIDFTPYKHNNDGAPWVDDTIIRIRGKDSVAKVWSNYLIKERAEQAAAGGKVVINGQEFYVAPEGGQKSGVVLYNAAQVDALLTGDMPPSQVQPWYVAYTTQRLNGRDSIISNQVPIVGSKWDLVYDPVSGVWNPVKSNRPDTPAAPGSSVPQQGGGVAPGGGNPASQPSAGPQGDDGGFPHTYREIWTQAPVNASLQTMNVPYRIYQQGDEGPFIALKKDDSGGLVSMRERDSPDGKGKIPSLAVGSQWDWGQVSPSLHLSGRTFAYFTLQRDYFSSVSAPYDTVGQYDKGDVGRFYVTDANSAKDVLQWMARRRQDRDAYVDKVLDAMNKKIKEIGGSFAKLTGVKSDPKSDAAWSYYIQTSLANDLEEGAFFWDQGGGSPGSPPPPPPPPGRKNPGGPSSQPTGGGQNPVKKPSNYTVGDGGTPPQSFSDQLTLKGDQGSDFKVYRQWVNEQQGLAVYFDVPLVQGHPPDSGSAKACFVQWRVKGADGKVTDNYTPVIQVYADGMPGGNACADGSTFSELKVDDPASVDSKNLYGKWDDDHKKFGLYGEAQSSGNKYEKLIAYVIAR